MQCGVGNAIQSLPAPHAPGSGRAGGFTCDRSTFGGAGTSTWGGFTSGSFGFSSLGGLGSDAFGLLPSLGGQPFSHLRSGVQRYLQKSALASLSAGRGPAAERSTFNSKARSAASADAQGRSVRTDVIGNLWGRAQIVA